MKKGFIPISLEDYIDLHMKANPGDNRNDVRQGLQKALADHKRGINCHCGNKIWIIGSAIVGNSCFTCITGEAYPDDDYEIQE